VRCGKKAKLQIMIEIFKDSKDTNYLSKEYNRIFTNKGIRHRDSFYIWILNLLTSHKYKIERLLDLACGEGALVSLARVKGINAIGIDISIDALRKSDAKCYLLAGNGERLPFRDESFDVITCIGSLEHFSDPLRGAREIQRLLTPDGLACILLPNTYSLFGNILFAARTGDVFDDGQPIQRYNTAQGWKRLLMQAGLSIQRMVKYELFPPRTSRDIRWYLARPKKLLRLLITPLVPLYLANCFVYLCQKEGDALKRYANLRIDCVSLEE